MSSRFWIKPLRDKWEILAAKPRKHGARIGGPSCDLNATLRGKLDWRIN